MKQLAKWKTRLRLLRMSTLAIVVTAFISVSVVLLTIYGANVGNFIVTIEENVQAYLAISEDIDFPENKAMLSATGIRNMTNTSYPLLPYGIGSTDGSESDGITYNAYSFYIKNVSNRAISYRMEITLRRVYKNVDYAMWIAVVKDGQKTVYAKAQTDGFGDYIRAEDGSLIPEGTDFNFTQDFTTVPFLSSILLAREDYAVFQPGEISRFTVIMWLEGEDPQCIDDIKGGTMHADMRFFALT